MYLTNNLAIDGLVSFLAEIKTCESTWDSNKYQTSL